MSLNRNIYIDEDIGTTVFRFLKEFRKLCKIPNTVIESIADLHYKTGSKKFLDIEVYHAIKNNALLTFDKSQKKKDEEMSLYKKQNVIVIYFNQNDFKSHCKFLTFLINNLDRILEITKNNDANAYIYKKRTNKFELWN